MTEESIWGPRATYSKLPHGYWNLAPILEAGHRAATLLLQMSDFCDTNRTDGMIRDAQLALFQPARGRADAVERLRNVGLVSRVDVPPGWQIEGWLLGHRSRDQLRSISEKRRSAGSKGGRAKPKPKPTEEAPPAPPDDLSLEDLVEQLASGLLDPKQCTAPQTNATTATAVDSNDRGGRGSGAAAVAAAAATAITRLGIPLEVASSSGIVQAVERALASGWTGQGIASKAAAARTKQFPASWFLSALEHGDDPTAHVRM